MIKKKLLSLIIGTVICTGMFATARPTTVSAASPATVAKPIAKLIRNILNTFGVPSLHESGLEAEARAGADVENLFFIPPKFENNKFCISAYNFFNKTGNNIMNKVVLYTEDGAAPRVYNLRSGDMLEIDTSPGTPDYILEFFAPGSSQPMDTIYLTEGTKNQNTGVALAQNNNIYYLQKETNRVINDRLIQEYYPNYDPSALYYSLNEDNKISLIENMIKYDNRWVYERAYRKSRLSAKSSVSTVHFGLKSVLYSWYVGKDTNVFTIEENDLVRSIPELNNW